MKREKIKLTNNFHNTECFVMVEEDGRLSQRQIRRAWKKLCGHSGCACGDAAGCRPMQIKQIHHGFTKDQDGFQCQNGGR